MECTIRVGALGRRFANLFSSDVSDVFEKANGHGAVPSAQHDPKHTRLSERPFPDAHRARRPSPDNPQPADRAKRGARPQAATPRAREALAEGMQGGIPAERLPQQTQPQQRKQQQQQKQQAAMVAAAPPAMRNERRVEERRSGFLGLRVAQTTVIDTQTSRQSVDRGQPLERVHERVCRWATSGSCPAVAAAHPGRCVRWRPPSLRSTRTGKRMRAACQTACQGRPS